MDIISTENIKNTFNTAEAAAAYKLTTNTAKRLISRGFADMNAHNTPWCSDTVEVEIIMCCALYIIMCSSQFVLNQNL